MKPASTRRGAKRRGREEGIAARGEPSAGVAAAASMRGVGRAGCRADSTARSALALVGGSRVGQHALEVADDQVARSARAGQRRAGRDRCRAESRRATSSVPRLMSPTKRKAQTGRLGRWRRWRRRRNRRRRRRTHGRRIRGAGRAAAGCPHSASAPASGQRNGRPDGSCREGRRRGARSVAPRPGGDARAVLALDDREQLVHGLGHGRAGERYADRLHRVAELEAVRSPPPPLRHARIRSAVHSAGPELRRAPRQRRSQVGREGRPHLSDERLALGVEPRREGSSRTATCSAT